MRRRMTFERFRTLLNKGHTADAEIFNVGGKIEVEVSKVYPPEKPREGYVVVIPWSVDKSSNG